MKSQQYYEPLIQEEQQASPIRGFQVTIGGTYVLMDDVVTAIREYAQSLGDPEHGALVHDVATWLQVGASQEDLNTLKAAAPLGWSEEPAPYVPHGAEPDDVNADVDRVEIVPLDEGGRIKWYARSIDTGGNVMKRGHANFDRSWVERNAEERWPGIPMYEVSDENERSMWKERGVRGYKHGLYPTAGAR